MSQKNPLKTSGLIALAAIVIIALTFGVVKPQLEKLEKNKETALLLFKDMKREEISEIELTTEKETLLFQKKKDSQGDWTVQNTLAPAPFVVDAEKMALDSLISSVLALKNEGAVEQKNFQDIGLNPPKFKLKISKGSQPSQDLLVGLDTPVDYFIFAKWATDASAFLSSRSLKFAVDKSLKDFRAHDVLYFKMADLLEVEMNTTGADKLPKIKWVLKKDQSNWKAISPFSTKLDSSEVTSLLEQFSSFRVVDFPSEKSTTEKTKYGLNQPMAVIAFRKADTVITWRLGFVFDKDLKKNRYYLNQDGKDSIYEASEEIKKLFNKTFFSLRPKKITEFNLADARIFTITNDKGESLEFVRGADNSNWNLNGSGIFASANGPAKNEAIEKALTALNNLQADNFLDNQSTGSLGLSVPTRQVEVRGIVGGSEKVLINLIIGKKLANGRTAVRSENMDAAAEIQFDTTSVLPMDPKAFQ